MFQPLLRDETLATRVSSEVEDLIFENHLQPGDRLPAERELAAQFGVSRTVVREAVRTLAAQGLLEVRQGSGTLVCMPSAESVTKSMTFFLKGAQPELDYRKVMEVRRLLEIEIAGLAAERRSERDLVAMERILEDTRGVKEKRERFVEWDIAFHSALAAATHNELFPLLLDSVAGTMQKVRELGFDVHNSPANALRFHRAIFTQVKERSSRGARNAMHAHLLEAEATMRKALALRTHRKAK